MDDNLYMRFESRDETVLADVDRLCGRLITSVARNITRSAEDAEEIHNDVLRKLWDSIPPAKPDSVKSYSAMIARRLALNRVELMAAKKRGTAIPLDELLEVASDDEISEKLEAKELGGAINGFLGNLRREERVMFIRRYVLAEEPGELAARLGITVNSLNVKLYRLRGRLRTYLKERDYIE